MPFQTPGHARAFHAAALFAVVGFVACSETIAPDVNNGRSSTRLSATSTTTTETTSPTPVESTTVSPTNADPTFIGFAASAPPLTSYDTSFTVVVGRAASFFLGSSRKGNSAFLVIEIPLTAEYFDGNGNALPVGTPVSIRVQVDPVTAAITFSPHGTRFGSTYPASLLLNTEYLNLGGLTPTSLIIWYLTDAGWVPEITTVTLTGNAYLKARLEHFSNYAVAY
ncbi:MAG: hypothetical protein OEW77_03125 [Gemmatimonadota bacterium]|nr:hypothetical protein [Gemmatimonadota bacterium]